MSTKSATNKNIYYDVTGSNCSNRSSLNIIIIYINIIRKIITLTRLSITHPDAPLPQRWACFEPPRTVYVRCCVSFRKRKESKKQWNEWRGEKERKGGEAKEKQRTLLLLWLAAVGSCLIQHHTSPATVAASKRQRIVLSSPSSSPLHYDAAEVQHRGHTSPATAAARQFSPLHWHHIIVSIVIKSPK
jgi:hypothetical protein